MNNDQTLLLAELPATDQDARLHPVQLRYSAAAGVGRFFYGDRPMRVVRSVRSSHVVFNSGDRSTRAELHDRDELPLDHLHDLVERVRAGHVFRFAYDPAARVWRATIDQTSQGAIYNAVVYTRWEVTLVLDLIHLTCDHTAHTYEDTST